MLKEARQIVLQEAIVKATTFDELKAIITMMLDTDDRFIEWLEEIQQHLANKDTDGLARGVRPAVFWREG